MTENEAKYYLLEHKPIIGFKTYNEALDVAIQALEEIQAIKNIVNDFALDCGSTVADIEEIWHQLRKYLKIGTVEDINKALNLGLKAQAELMNYQKIGTVEEFKALKEKATPKKPREWANGTLHCPNEDCEFDNTCLGFDVCVKCGQKLDFGKGE